MRSALGIHAVESPPPVRLRIVEIPGQSRIDRMLERVAALAGKTLQATAAEARAYVAELVAGKTAIASNAPFLQECGITDLPNVRSGIVDRGELRALCANCDFGIASADYALADTGTLVMLSSPHEARMISLLPPAHIAIVPAQKVLSGLDELLTLLPRPAEQTSSMVLITGPSRTGDIEQILVRGVHGPGEIHVIVVDA
ncbi:MAG: lactate utilization protein [Acidobacteriota bacterium]|nr:lactate utilization protein [Acidobacteriota bacterium]